jgi:hypothetical protein
MAFLGTRSSHTGLHFPHNETESLASLSECRARGARQLRLLAQHEEAARCCRRRSGRGCTCHGGVGSSGALGAGRAACKGKPRSSAARHAASRVHDPAPTLDRLPALCIPLVHLKTIPKSYALYTDPDSCKEWFFIENYSFGRSRFLFRRVLIEEWAQREWNGRSGCSLAVCIRRRKQGYDVGELQWGRKRDRKDGT